MTKTTKRRKTRGRMTDGEGFLQIKLAEGEVRLMGGHAV